MRIRDVFKGVDLISLDLSRYQPICTPKVGDKKVRDFAKTRFFPKNRDKLFNSKKYRRGCLARRRITWYLLGTVLISYSS